MNISFKYVKSKFNLVINDVIKESFETNEQNVEMKKKLKNFYSKALSIAAYDTSNIEIHRIDCYKLVSFDKNMVAVEISNELVERLTFIDYLSINYIMPFSIGLLPTVDSFANVFEQKEALKIRRY